MSSGFKLTCLFALSLLASWACAPDLDSLSAEYGVDTGGSAGSSTGGKSSQSGDSGSGPLPAACSNLDHDADESDVDCGGTSDCKRCGTNLRCSSNNDCQSGFCRNSRCAAPTCADGLQNQEETGVDCGGPCAPNLGCELEEACVVNQDCKSEYCKDEVCTDHCQSGVREADETDKDCGGSCETKCGTDRRCVESSDCESKICVNNKCQAATCDDRVLNQDESDKDCGGACALEGKPCPVAGRCNSGADCETWVCSKNRCAADIDVPAEDMIDDFEDGNFNLLDLGGRKGNWYVYGDGTGTVTDEITGVQARLPVSPKVLHTTGADFTKWGSGIGVDIYNPGSGPSEKEVYDASAYSGVTFWAKSAAPQMVSVVFPDGDTDAAGGVCTTCDHHYFKSVQIDTEWKRYTIDFSELDLENGVDPVPDAFDPSRLVSFQLRIFQGQTYELWIDDVAFVK